MIDLNFFDSSPIVSAIHAGVYDPWWLEKWGGVRSESLSIYSQHLPEHPMNATLRPKVIGTQCFSFEASAINGVPSDNGPVAITETKPIKPKCSGDKMEINTMVPANIKLKYEESKQDSPKKKIWQYLSLHPA